MKIIELKVDKPFRYLWLKKVTGIQLSVHCACCLKGEYSKVINRTVTELHDHLLPNGIFYLCGVSNPYKWENNFHLAFTNGTDTLTYESNGIKVVIAEAKQLPISPTYIDATHPKAQQKEYCTCRNWQFAHYLKQAHIFS